MNSSNTVSPRSRTVTLILALCFFVVGFGGLHRIYTGKLFSGILQLLTCGGLIIWQIIDVIRILCGTFDDAQDRDITEW
ncbi:MAG: TM2 domain-containing protein [Akkermansia sp.]|nr:TM2 domain-containing protein [Akkermansia sp.]